MLARHLFVTFQQKCSIFTIFWIKSAKFQWTENISQEARRTKIVFSEIFKKRKIDELGISVSSHGVFKTHFFISRINDPLHKTCFVTFEKDDSGGACVGSDQHFSKKLKNTWQNVDFDQLGRNVPARNSFHFCEKSENFQIYIFSLKRNCFGIFSKRTWFPSSSEGTATF